MANTILMVITLALAVFIVVTKKFVWIPFFIILLGASLLPKSIKAIKNPENKDGEFGAYINIIIFGAIVVFFLFLLLSGRLYQ